MVSKRGDDDLYVFLWGGPTKKTTEHQSSHKIEASHLCGRGQAVKY